MSQRRLGVLLGAAAYLMWGAFPLYWPLLKPAGAVEILAHRMVWSLLTMLVILVLARRVRALMTIPPRARLLLVAAGVTIAMNWGTFIYGVNSGRVVETSLGYFINPLVTVLFAVALLGERLRPMQWIALTVSAFAVLVIAIEYGRPPWIALILAFSFGTYGLMKKQAGVEAIESLAFETLVLAPVALGYLIWLGFSGGQHFTGHGLGHATLVAATGIVTAIPLLCFGAAAIRVPMTTLGLLQYLGPILQFLIGVAALHERMTAGRWIGFSLVWVALAILTVDALSRSRRRQPGDPTRS